MDNTVKHKFRFPNQYVSKKEKEKKRWYIPAINYIIDRAEGSNNKTLTNQYIDEANGIINSDTINYVTKVYGTDKANSRFPKHIRDIGIINGIKERYIGEFIKQYNNYQVFVQDSDAVFQRNKELYKAVSTKLMAKFEELLQGKEEDLKEFDVEAFADNFIEEWADERAIRGQERLNLIQAVTDGVVKYIEAFFYWFATEEVYTYRDVNNEDLVKEIVPPWEYYRVDSGNLFVEDDDMGMRKFTMSINQIKSKFKDDLTKADFDYLEELMVSSDNATIDNRLGTLIYNRFLEHASGFDGVLDNVNVNTLLKNFDKTDYSGKVFVYHTVWKTQTKVYNLKYRDLATNEEDEMLVPADYKFNPLAGDIEMKEDWINETYEGYRLGGITDGIYIKARPVKVQRQEINDTNKCKLPYNGLSYLLPGNLKNPIPHRLIEYELLLKLYHYQREKAIAKFKAFNLVPESILLDSKNMKLEERIAYGMVDDILPYNDYDIDPQVLNGIKNLYNQGAERYIQILNEVIRSVKEEAMEQANMNDQRMGDINQRAGKATTEYAITKATTGSILMFEMFNKFRERDHMADLDWSKAAWINGKRGSYIDPETKQTVYVDIDGVSELGTNLAVFIKNSVVEEEKLSQLRDLAFAASQNGDLSAAAEAIDADNASTVKKIIREAEKERRAFEERQLKTKEAIEKEITKRDISIEQVKGDIEHRLQEYKDLQENKRTYADLSVKLEEIEKKYATSENQQVIDKFKEEIELAKQNIQQQKMDMDRYKAIQQSKQQKEKV